MRVTAKPAEISRLRLRKVFDRLESMPDRVFQEGAPECMATYTWYVDRIFADEGDPTWAPLRPRTVSDRTILGFGPEHPILQREGYLHRAVSDPGFGPQTVQIAKVGPDETYYSEPHRTGAVQDFQHPAPGHHLMRFGTIDDRFEVLQLGDWDMPARPMTPSGGLREAMSWDLESTMVEITDRLAVLDGG